MSHRIMGDEEQDPWLIPVWAWPVLLALAGVLSVRDWWLRVRGRA